MPAAKNKTELLSITEKEWEKLQTLLDKLSGDLAAQKFEGDTSIKDVTLHRAHWICLFLGWHHDGEAGREVYIPAKGYNWSELKAYNTALRDEKSGVSWKDARAELTAAHERLMAFYVAQNDQGLYGGPLKGGNGKWTAGRYSESAGASHYRSAAKFVRSCMRNAG